MARSLRCRPGPRHPIIGMAIKLYITTQAVIERIADALLSTPSLPAGPRKPPKGWIRWRPREFQAMTIGQEDLHLHELKRALASLPRKKSAPGPDGVTNQALRNLEEDALPELLAYLNEVWTTACLPEDWNKAIVVPLLKPGKPSDQPNSYRPIALTSCVGKLLERIILCRLVHHLETVGALPECYAGFGRGRCTADAIADLVTALEDGKARHRTTGVVLLDISKAFDAVEHNSIVTELKRLGIGGRMLAFIRAFLEGREAQVSAAGVCSTVRRMTRGVPQGSVLSPLLFSVALAALPQAARIGERMIRPVHMAVYANDIAIWAADRGCCRKSVQKELQRALDNMYHFLTTLGLSLSEAKSVALLNAPHRTYKFTLFLQIAGAPVPIVKQATYLGLKLDDSLVATCCEHSPQQQQENDVHPSHPWRARTLYALPLLDLNHGQAWKGHKEWHCAYV
ncbi:hypothetical protein ISCGN_016975 [Ixodes scapularis]